MDRKRTRDILQLEELARLLRRDVIECIGVGHAGHVGGSCSSADIVAALYFSKMEYDPEHPDSRDRDRFLLSKGHAALIQYAALAEAGFFPREELGQTKRLGAMLQGHPDVRKTPGIEAGTGSLGQGLSIGLGLALAQRLDGSPHRTYVLLGDGELNEGQVWEAAMAAAAHHADRLVALLDWNGLQATGPTSERFDPGPIPAKWAAFGWQVQEIDGHDMAAILAALDRADECAGKPHIILAHTVKGKGISFAENIAAFHNGALDKTQYRQALHELS